LRSPGHRYALVKEALAGTQPRPDDYRMRQLLEILEGSATETPTIRYAFDLFKDAEHRTVLDAFMLARCPTSLISTALEIPVEVIDAYAHLFMDMSVFRNKLEVLSYAKDYPGGPYAREMTRTAVTVGYEYLLWTYGNPTEDVVDSRYIVRKTMIDAFFRGQAHKGNALTSAMAKEAKAWTGMAVANAALIEKIDPRTAKAAVNELRIAIEGKDSTLTPDTAPVPVEDILH
jgi:hypothetical protein